MNVFLEATHELTKQELAQLHKQGKIKPNPKPKKTKKDICFHKNDIIAAFMKYKIDVENIDDKKGITDFDKNFDEYSKMRMEAEALEKKDITQSIICYLEILGQTTPTASLYWERPMILLERIKMYKEAHFICQRAIEVSKMPSVRMGDFDLRFIRLSKKIKPS